MTIPYLEEMSIRSRDGTVNRTMADVFSDIKNVKDFGAVGDNVADDTAAIQAAVDWTAGANRGVVFFPPGTYKLESSITFNYDGILSIIFRGVGGQSVITGYFADYLLKRVSVPYNPSNGTRVIEGLKFVNSHAAGGCVRIEASIGCAVRDCVFEGWRGLNAEGNQSMTVDACTFSSSGLANAVGIAFGDNGTISNCDITGFLAGIRPAGVGINIRGCRFEVNTVGIELGRNAVGTQVSISNFSIIGCSFESNGTAVYCYGGSGNGLVSGLYITGFEGSGPAGSHPQYGIDSNSDCCTHTLFAGNFVGGQYQQASYRMQNSTPPAGVTFISCTGNNASTLGGVIWSLPTKAHTVALINCNYSDAITSYAISQTFTFANLPANPAEGQEFNITDSNTATWGATAAGGGANHVKVRYNGTNWTVAGA